MCLTFPHDACVRIADAVSDAQANVAYTLWTAAFNTSFLLVYLLIEIAFFPRHNNGDGTTSERIQRDADVNVRGRIAARRTVPHLFEAINSNSLAVFLAVSIARMYNI